MQRITIDKRKDGVRAWVLQIDDDYPVPVTDLTQVMAFVMTYPENKSYWDLERGQRNRRYTP